jgi:hypothetical protein
MTKYPMTKSEGRIQVIPRSSEESTLHTCRDGHVDPSEDLGMTAIRLSSLGISSFVITPLLAVRCCYRFQLGQLAIADTESGDRDGFSRVGVDFDQRTAQPRFAVGYLKLGWV